MSDPTKIRGFRNVSTSHQAVFITEGGEAKISQISPLRWKVLPRGGKAYEVIGKQEAIEEARGIATGLTPSHLRELQEKHRRLQSSLLAEPPKKKSSAQIKREIDEVLAPPREQTTDVTWFRFATPGAPPVIGVVQGSGGVIRHGKEEATRRLRRETKLAKEGKPLGIYEPHRGHVRVFPHYGHGGRGEPHVDVDLRRATFKVVATPGDRRPV